MTNINLIFSRLLMVATHKDARAAGYRTPMRSAWVWKYGRQNYEFHGPDDFYWYGTATNAYEARSKGWSALLESKKTEVTS